jgi:S1-C subfamily serine protease
MTVSISVAYNNTETTLASGFNECIFITKKRDTDTDYDIGLIQLENKRTPPNINCLPVAEDSVVDSLKINEQVYMIGFNSGYALAITDNGIKSQLTQGYITQEPDDHRILYSIPTLQGASGSPILNKWGQVIAINYAKMQEDQGFCFGVPVEHLKRLYSQFEYKIHGQ